MRKLDYILCMDVILSQLKEIIDKDLPQVTNLSNAAAILNQLENINWCGFYLKEGDYLFLGPFQGDVACTKIPLDKGVCGKAARDQKTIIVDDVNQFPGHIACSNLSKSEIVVPIIKDNQVKAVIDIDAPIYARFTVKEQAFLEQCAEILAPLFK